MITNHLQRYKKNIIQIQTKINTVHSKNERLKLTSEEGSECLMWEDTDYISKD